MPGPIEMLVARREADVRTIVSAFSAPVLVALAYYLGAQAAFAIGTLSDRIFAPFWPPNVVLFCTLLVVPTRRWWLFIAAVFPAHVLAEIQVGMPPAQNLVAFATNVLVAMLNAASLRLLIGEPPWLGTLRNGLIYIAVTVIASPAIAGLGGAFVRVLGEGTVYQYGTYWANWYFANALASATLGPVFLAWFNGRIDPRIWPLRQKIEVGLLLVALIVACGIAFGISPEAIKTGLLPTLLYLPVPIVLWATIRFGAKGASGAVLVVTLVSIWSNLSGATMFRGETAEENVLALQFFLTAMAIPVLLLGAAIDELRGAAHAMQHLAGSFLRAQDEERRQTARGLLDGVAQNLVALDMRVSGLRHDVPAPRQHGLDVIDDLVQRTVGELRALSYVLHPPLLDEAGLELALKSCVRQLCDGRDVEVELSLPEDLARLPRDVELVVFRVFQEALTNVLRHSESSVALVSLSLPRVGDGQHVVLAVEDRGKGMPRSTQLSAVSGRRTATDDARLGLESMRERLRQVGGRLQIDSTPGRTVVTATIPLA
jgi:signal transduction histidine kinase